MWIKICGNTSLEDASSAAALGAAALGFIFARSPRQVSAATVAAITSSLPATAERIGVFDTHSPAEIAAIAAEAGLTGAQLHRAFDPAAVTELVSLAPGLAVIQVLHWTLGADPTALSEQLSADLRSLAALAQELSRPIRVLIDTKAGSASGGTGLTYDWAAAAALFRTAAELGLAPIAAGGLRPSNVAEAIRALRPAGVDVSSGVELSPGKKDPAAVAQFLAKARGG